MDFASFDAEYVGKLAAGDPDVESHFTNYFGSLLLIKLRTKLRSPQMIEDVRQDTFLRVLQAVRRRPGLEHPERLGAYVNSVCNNVLMEYYRSIERHSQPPEDAPEPVDELADTESEFVSWERKKMVEKVLAELPKKDRELIRKIFLDDQDKAEVCREMKVSGEYLRVLLHRAKARFREALLKDQRGGPLESF